MKGRSTDPARVVRTNGDAKLSLNKGVVDQVGHVLECLSIVLAGRERQGGEMYKNLLGTPNTNQEYLY